MNQDRFKFRAWEESIKLMWEVLSIDWDHQEIRVQRGIHVKTSSLRFFTLLQATGLKDKNGKLIFEGDIVKYTHNTAIQKQFDYVESVYFEDCHFKTKTFYLCATGIGEFEVIGTIYENPELLLTK